MEIDPLMTPAPTPQLSTSGASTAPLRIAIVTDLPDPREAKLGRAIRLAGGEPSLICRREPSFDATRDFGHVIRIGTPWEALDSARSLGADLYHVCAQMNYDLAAAFVAHRPAPVVLDSYDLLTGMWTEKFFAEHGHFDAARQVERFCLESADGLCMRSLQPQHLKRNFGVTLPRTKIFWPEYCWGDVAASPKLSATDGKLHVVYNGTVSAGDNPADWLARMLDDFGVHFHLYPLGGPPDRKGFEDRFANYFELANQLEHFHVHYPLPSGQWLGEFSKYDVMPMIAKFVAQGSTGELRTLHQVRLNTANKCFDCLDGNVLFLVHEAFVLVSRIAARYGFGRTMTWNQFRRRGFWTELHREVVSGGFDWAQQRTALNVAANSSRFGTCQRL